MTRRRHNDPLGVSDRPNVVTDPARVAAAQAELRRKFKHIDHWYRMQKQLGLDRRDFNASLARLKKQLASPASADSPKKLLSPWLQLAINIEARELAGLPDDAFLTSEHAGYVLQAAINLANRANGVRGAPGQGALRQCVEGIMAIIQESTGQPVMAQRDDKDGVYDPKVLGSGGWVIRMIVDTLEPNVPDVKLSYWVREARKKYAGKPMRFRDMFPAYGATVDPDTGAPAAKAPYRFERFRPIAQIYCP